MINKKPIDVDSDSSSVHAHLTIMQNVIQRMAANSTACKTLCITLVSAVLVLIADKGEPDYAYIALLPTVVFCILDTYYLALEKSLRMAYGIFLYKLHSQRLTTDDLFAVSSKGNMSGFQVEALSSLSVWGFYLPLIVLIFVTKNIALG